MSRLFRRKDSPNWYYTDGTSPNRVMKSTGTGDKRIAERLRKHWDKQRILEKHGIIKGEAKPMPRSPKPKLPENKEDVMTREVEHRFDTTVMQTRTARNLCQIIARLAVPLQIRSTNGDREVIRELQSAKSVDRAFREARNRIGKFGKQ